MILSSSISPGTCSMTCSIVAVSSSALGGCVVGNIGICPSSSYSFLRDITILVFRAEEFASDGGVMRAAMEDASCASCRQCRINAALTEQMDLGDVRREIRIP